MTRVLLDINVVLDVLASREPFADDAEAVLRHVETRSIEGLVAAHTITTLHFLLAKTLGKTRTGRVLTSLLHLVGVGPRDRDPVWHPLP